MPVELPYMMAVGNIGPILDRIQEAGTPPKFTHEFMKNSLGFRSSSDRGIVKVLRQLGFLSSDATPTARYNRFRSKSSGGAVLAEGLREGWAEIFLADQRAHEKSSSQLAETFKGVTGAGDASAAKMAQTFKTLASRADWSASAPHAAASSDEAPALVERPASQPASNNGAADIDRSRLRLHHDIHIHLPATSDVAVYTAIFRALREELRD